MKFIDVTTGVQWECPNCPSWGLSPNREAAGAQAAKHLCTACGVPPCECADSLCHFGETLGPAGRLASRACVVPAVMHLFRVDIMVHETAITSGGPVDFCEPCGDKAMQSGAFATGEDVADARRKAGTP